MSSAVSSNKIKKKGACEPSRGDATRVALINAGIILFSAHGFEATSTRMLTNHAGANLSAIPYYFGNKHGLYIAALEHITESLNSHIRETRTLISEKVKQKTLTPQEALRSLQLLVDKMVSFFVEGEEPKMWTLLIMREQANPTVGFDILYNGQIKHMQKIITSLIGIGLGRRSDSLEVKIKGHALFGQILSFVVAREGLLRQLGVDKLGVRHIKQIRETLEQHVAACVSPLCKGNRA